MDAVQVEVMHRAIGSTNRACHTAALEKAPLPQTHAG